jgi:hypothetical protein
MVRSPRSFDTLCALLRVRSEGGIKRSKVATRSWAAEPISRRLEECWGRKMKVKGEKNRGAPLRVMKSSAGGRRSYSRNG